MTEGTKRRRSLFIPVSRSIDPAETAEAADKLDSESSLAVIEHEDDTVEVGFDVDSAALWQYVAKEIRMRPQWVSQQTGIEWIAYGPELPPPEPLPRWEEMETEFETHCKTTDEEKRKVLAAWRDFKSTAKVASLRDITPAIAIVYRDAVHGRGLSGKMQSHIFNRVRRFLRFYSKERAKCVEPISRALTALAILRPNETTVSLDPKPIEVSEFKALLKVATGDDRAFLLLMLNAALYQQEVVNLKWEDIKQDKYLIAHRAKTGRCVRVAVLWQETIDVLKQMARKGEYIFVGEHGFPLKGEGARRRFERLRERANLKEVTSSQLRDGACTAAAEANVNEAICRLLAGHRSGISDHYCKRNPQMVAPACAAVYAKYFAA